MTWLVWVGYDRYTKIDDSEYSRKRGILFLEYWLYLPLEAIMTLVWIPYTGPKEILYFITMSIYYGYFYN